MLGLQSLSELLAQPRHQPGILDAQGSPVGNFLSKVKVARAVHAGRAVAEAEERQGADHAPAGPQRHPQDAGDSLLGEQLRAFGIDLL